MKLLEQSHLIKQYDQASLVEKKLIINDLIKLFVTTTDMLERNEIAFFFAYHQIVETIPIIVNVIKKTECYNQIGSLIYALRDYPAMPTKYLVDFIPIVANGTFEAAHESYLLILEQSNKLNVEEVKKICTLLMSRYDQGCANDDLVLDLLNELNI